MWCLSSNNISAIEWVCLVMICEGFFVSHRRQENWEFVINHQESANQNWLALFSLAGLPLETWNNQVFFTKIFQCSESGTNAWQWQQFLSNADSSAIFRLLVLSGYENGEKHQASVVWYESFYHFLKLDWHLPDFSFKIRIRFEIKKAQKKQSI